MLTLNREYGAFVGIDLGETHIRFELFDLIMNLLHTVTSWLDDADVQPRDVVEEVVTGYRQLLTAVAFPEEKILGVGIGVPGVVQREGGISVFAPNWGWHDVQLLAQIQEYITPPIIMDNGAKALGLAEMWFGVRPGTQHFIALLLGTGVGTAIIADGSLQRGISNSAGEWGHMTLDLNGRVCRCGGQGCLETYVGAPGIIQTLREIAPDSAWLQNHSQLDIIDQILAAADDHHAIAMAILAQTTHYLGAGIANLINLYNPQTIVLGGWLGNRLGSFVLEQLPAYIEKYALPQPRANIKLRLSQLGDNGIAMGAACLILEDFLHGKRNSWRLSTGTVSLLSN